jgi:hypothetical protein
MFDKNNSDNIEKFNAFYGMKHRSTPYDLTNSNDLKQAFLLTVAACMDYRRYWMELTNIEEQFDESIEYYDTATWINMGLSPENADELAFETTGLLRATTDSFYTLMERGERNCAVILKAILSATANAQKAVWGKSYSIPEGTLDDEIKALFEGLDEVETHYNMEKNRDEFLALMEAKWGNYVAV